MNTYYKFKGRLIFANNEIAKQAYEYLIGNEKTCFFLPPEHRNDPKFTAALMLKGNVLIIYHENYGSDLIYSTADAIRYISNLSISGGIVFQDGEEVHGQVERYHL